MDKSQLQKFTVEKRSRSSLKLAAYNPRKISEQSKAKLRSNLKRVGLLTPIVMNRRTGNVISGHQRLAILDATNKTLNYTLDVAIVDLDEKTEKEQVIFFNNESAMGRFTLDKLNALLKEVDPGHCGFDDTQLKMMANIGFEVAPPQPEAPPTAEAPKQKPSVPVGTFARIRKESTERKDERYPEDKDVEFFLVVVFQSESAREEFQKLVGSSDQSIDGQIPFRMLGGVAQ